MSSYVGGTRALPPVLSPGGSYPRSLSPGMIPPAMIESRGMPETRRFLHARAGPRSGPNTKAKPVMAAACSDDAWPATSPSCTQAREARPDHAGPQRLISATGSSHHNA